jgi:hypothetical protein
MCIFSFNDNRTWPRTIKNHIQDVTMKDKPIPFDEYITEFKKLSPIEMMDALAFAKIRLVALNDKIIQNSIALKRLQFVYERLAIVSQQFQGSSKWFLEKFQKYLETRRSEHEQVELIYQTHKDLFEKQHYLLDKVVSDLKSLLNNGNKKDPVQIGESIQSLLDKNKNFENYLEAPSERNLVSPWQPLSDWGKSFSSVLKSYEDALRLYAYHLEESISNDKELRNTVPALLQLLSFNQELALKLHHEKKDIFTFVQELLEKGELEAVLASKVLRDMILHEIQRDKLLMSKPIIMPQLETLKERVDRETGL